MKRASAIIGMMGMFAFSACSGDEPGSGSDTGSGGPDLGPAISCESAPDCPDGFACIDETCTPNVCASDEECDDVRQECSDEGLCVFRAGFADACDAERPCPFGEFCSELLGQCLDTQASRDCVRRAQCPSGQICDRAASKCIPNPGCLDDTFCEPGEICDVVRRECRIDDRVFCDACTGDGDCGGGTCDPETGACIPLGREGPCARGEFCGVLGLCVQCQQDSDCGDSLFCNVSSGTCDSRVQCADEVNDCSSDPNVRCTVCEGALVCNRRTQRCEPPPEPCMTDTECTEGEFCQTAFDPPICVPRAPECLNDALDDAQDNGSFATASPITPGALDELVLCPGELDHYRVDVEAGTVVTFDARFSQMEGDLELQLFLDDGQTIIADARSATDNERIRVELGTARTLFLRAFLSRPEPQGVPYRLVFTEGEGEVCTDDMFEPNDAPDETAALRANVPIDAQICAADPDYYLLSAVPVGARVELDLDFVPGTGDLDLDVFRRSEPSPLFSSRSVSETESLVFPATFGGDFIVRVSGRRTDQNPYTLRARVVPDAPTAVCPDDPEEANDSPATAATVGGPQGGLPFVFSGDRALCPGDEDWFRVPFTGLGGVLAVELSHEPDVDLDVFVYEDVPDPLQQSPLATGRTIREREFFTFSDFAPRQTLVRVAGVRPSDIGAYTINIVNEESFICGDDAFDAAGQGNARASAAAIGTAPLRVDDLTLCSGDQDFYRVTLLPGFTYDLRLQWRRQNTTVEFITVPANGFPVAPQVRRRGNTSIISVAVGGGPANLILQPVISVGFQTDYSIVIDARPTVDCSPDAFDPNDTPASAAPLSPPIDASDLVLCPSNRNPNTGQGDEDYFSIPVTERGARIEATASFEQGDLLLELLGPDPSARACLNEGGNRCFSDGVDSTEDVSFTVTSTGTYLLRVSSFYSTPFIPQPGGIDTPYTLSVDVVPPP